MLKLGFAVAQSTVTKYMARTDGRPSGQRWGTFLRNHLPQIAAMDLFVVPTIGFNLLYVLVIVQLARRELVRINVTAHPTAEWIARQVTEAFPWNKAPRYLIRDRDGIVICAPTLGLLYLSHPILAVCAGSLIFAEVLRDCNSLMGARGLPWYGAILFGSHQGNVGLP